MGRVRRHLTFANVASALALFVAISGASAYAAGLIGPNDIANDAIRTRHVKNGQVMTKDLANSAVSGVKIANDAVNGAKVGANSLTGADVNESTLRVSNVIARPTGGTLAAGGLTTGGTTPYPIANGIFTQRPGEILEFVTEIKATLATPPSSVNTLCQVAIDLKLDGQPFVTVNAPGSNSDQPVTKTVALRQSTVRPSSSNATQHSVTATAHLVDHSGEGFTDACSSSSRVDSFVLDVIGTR